MPTFDLFRTWGSVILVFGRFERLFAEEKSVRTEVSVPLRASRDLEAAQPFVDLLRFHVEDLCQRKSSANRFRWLRNWAR